jgi:O-antigen/teichoic acid export membrane protein
MGKKAIPSTASDDVVDGSAPARRRSTLVYAIATYGANVAVAVLSLVNVLIVSRALGPAGRGGVAFLMSMTQLTALVGGLGIQSANAYFGGSKPHLRPSLATNSVALAFILGSLTTGFVALLIRLFPAVGGHIDAGTRWIALASTPVVVLGTYLWILSQSDYRFGFTNMTWLLPPLTNVLANGALAGAGILTVRSAMSVWVAGQALSTGLMGWYVARRLSGFGRLQGRLGRQMLGFGLKTQAGQIGMIGNYRLDQWLLGAISGSRRLGLYSVAVSWAEVLFFLPNAIASVQRPDLVRADRSEAGRQAEIAFRAAALFTLVSAVVMIAAAPFLCVTIFGAPFRGSIRDLRILALGALGIVAIKQLGNTLMSQGKPMLETAGIVVAFLMTVVVDILLIPPYKDVGASLASTLTYLAGGLVMALIYVHALDRRLSELVPRAGDVRWCWERLRQRLPDRRASAPES